MMSLIFGLFTQMSDSGPHGPLVVVPSVCSFISLCVWPPVHSSV